MKKTKVNLNRLQLKKENIMPMTGTDNVLGGGLTIITVCAAGRTLCLDDTCGSQAPEKPKVSREFTDCMTDAIQCTWIPSCNSTPIYCGINQ